MVGVHDNDALKRMKSTCWTGVWDGVDDGVGRTSGVFRFLG